jgi:hypothetical protein
MDRRPNLRGRDGIVKSTINPVGDNMDVGKAIVGDGAGTLTGGSREDSRWCGCQGIAGRRMEVDGISRWRPYQFTDGTASAGRASFSLTANLRTCFAGRH